MSFVLMVVFWQLLVTIGGYDRFILPGPVDVWDQLQIVVSDGRLIRHTLYTVSEIIPGLLIGCLIAVPLGYVLAKSRLAERFISPYLVASQAVPIIAIAPLLHDMDSLHLLEQGYRRCSGGLLSGGDQHYYRVTKRAAQLLRSDEFFESISMAGVSQARNAGCHADHADRIENRGHPGGNWRSCRRIRTTKKPDRLSAGDRQASV